MQFDRQSNILSFHAYAGQKDVASFANNHDLTKDTMKLLDEEENDEY